MKAKLPRAGLIALLIFLVAAGLGGGWYFNSFWTTQVAKHAGPQGAQPQAAAGTQVQSSPASDLQASSPEAEAQAHSSPAQAGSTPADADTTQALSYYEQGLKLYYQKSFPQALALFNQALALDANCYQALNSKGATYAFQGRHSEGIALIKQALALKPDFEYGYFNLGLANELAGNWDAAIAAYQTALRYDSHDAWAYYGIASIYGRQGNVDQTVVYLQQAIANEPDARETAKTEPDFDPVRHSTKFQALLQPGSALTSQKSTSSPLRTEPAIPVLYYHSILTEKGNPVRMPPEQFADQMRYLAANGYHVLTPAQLDQALAGNGQIPSKPFMITLDDGYADNYTNAFPILQKYGFVATVFMVTDYIDGSGYLSTDQLQRLQAAGWTIGGHTQTHPDLCTLKPEEIEKELTVSRETLKNILGQDVLYFAYPYGKYNQTVMKKVQQDGYRLAFTTEKGWVSPGQNLMLLPRVYCYANMGMDEFIKRVTHPDY
jgi:peptidoglycan/xylan/chitin deacetylase (PgdA/CDA1 family)/Flp pilus assembly protein TadD